MRNLWSCLDGRHIGKKVELLIQLNIITEFQWMTLDQSNQVNHLKQYIEKTLKQRDPCSDLRVSQSISLINKCFKFLS